MGSLKLLTAEENAVLRKAFIDLSPIQGSSQGASQKPVEPHLKGVLDSVLENPGSLTRAQLSYKILARFGESQDMCLKLACGIEYFHSASLIFDDLPCMDDAQERRGSKCVHHSYGEAAATLGALSLITRAYALIWQVLNSRPWHQRQWASDYLEKQIGALGILNGQACDIYFSQSNGGGEEVTRIAMGKTVSLIRLSLVFPAILGGAKAQTLERLDQLAIHWGLAYQAIDDGKDVYMALSETGKTPNRDELLSRPNLYHAEGNSQAEKTIQNHLTSARHILKVLNEPVSKQTAWAFLNMLQEHMETSFSELTSTHRRPLPEENLVTLQEVPASKVLDRQLNPSSSGSGNQRFQRNHFHQFTATFCEKTILTEGVCVAQ